MLALPEHGFFNIGSGNEITIKELASLMIKISGKSLEPQFDKIPAGDIKLSKADISLSTKILGWKAKTTLEEGLRTLF